MNFKQGGMKYVRKGNRTLPPPLPTQQRAIHKVKSNGLHGDCK